MLLEEWLATLRRRAREEGTIDCASVTLAGWCATQLSVLREMSLGVTRRLVDGQSPMVEAALVKDLGTGFEQALPAVIADALAATPDDEVEARSRARWPMSRRSHRRSRFVGARARSCAA